MINRSSDQAGALMHIVRTDDEHGQLKTLRTFCKNLTIPERIKALNDTADGDTVLQMATRTTRRYVEFDRDKIADGVNLEVVKELIDNGADIDHIDAEGHTALYYAIYYNVTLAKTLLDKGADVNLGLPTPLYEAISTSVGKTEMVEMLLQKGANPNQLQLDKTTAFDLAIHLVLERYNGFGCNFKTRFTLVNLLLSYGAIITNFDAFYKFLHEERLDFYYSLFSNPHANDLNAQLNENKVLDLITGCHALLTQLEKQKISFPHEAEIRKFFKEVSELSVEYRKKICTEINQTSNADIPLDITDIMSDYLGYKSSVNTSEPQHQKAPQSEDDKPVYFHYPRGKKSHYPFLFAGEIRSTDNKDKIIARTSLINN